MTATSPATVTLLLRLAKLVHRGSTEDVLGMRLRQYQVLYTLREHGQMRQQDLCERLWLDPNNCVLLLNEVEALGYVERRRDPEDRRRHVVDITPEGLRAFERAEQAQAGLEGEILGALSDEERATLHRLLSKALERPRG
jgi:DNA-binding MarR family transcriptional regulator